MEGSLQHYPRRPDVRKFLEHGHVEHHVGQVERVVDEGHRDKDVRVISARDGFWPPSGISVGYMMRDGNA
jgi:hypothetical protein